MLKMSHDRRYATKKPQNKSIRNIQNFTIPHNAPQLDLCLADHVRDCLQTLPPIRINSLSLVDKMLETNSFGQPTCSLANLNPFGSFLLIFDLFIF